MDGDVFFPIRSEQRAESHIPDGRQFVQPLWHTALFIVLSFGLYLFPWAYRCRRFCNASWAASGRSDRRSPLGRTLTLIIPIYGWFYAFYRLAADVDSAAESEAALSPAYLNGLYIATWVAVRFLPFPATLLSFAGMLTCLLTVQAQINRTCEYQRPGVVSDARLGWRGVLGISIALLLWAGLGYRFFTLTAPSSGVATVRFGHALDATTLQLLQPADTFAADAQIVWRAQLNGTIGDATVRRTIDQRIGSRMVQIASDDLQVPDAGGHFLAEGGSAASYSGAVLYAGSYTVRFWRGNSVIASGSFTLTGATALVPDLEASSGTDATGTPIGIARGRDAMYFTAPHALGRITPSGAMSWQALPTSYGAPLALTADADGTLWYTDQTANVLGRRWPDGHLSELAIPIFNGQPAAIAVGLQHQVWFTGAGGSFLGTVSPQGAISMRTVGTDDSPFVAVAVDEHGNAWAADDHSGAILRVAATGRTTVYPVPSESPGLAGITTGPGGTVWFTEAAANRIGRLDAAGHITEFVLPESLSGPQAITRGPDGALWFTERTGNSIGRITPSGGIREYPVPTPASQPMGIAAGPGNTIWFTEAAASQIGVLHADGTMREFPIGTAPDAAAAIAAPAATLPGEHVTVYPVHVPGRKGDRSYFSNPAYIGSLAIGPDGRAWFTEPSANALGTLGESGIIQTIPITEPATHCTCGSSSNDLDGPLTTGPDHNLWFTVHFQFIGKRTASGALSYTALPHIDDAPSSLTSLDGALWFLNRADSGPSSLVRLSRDGHTTRIRLPDNPVGSGVAAGPRQTLWFAGYTSGTQIVRYDLATGAWHNFALPSSSETQLDTPVLGPDGRMWFTEATQNQLAAVSFDGQIDEYPLPSGGPSEASTGPHDLVLGSDHHMWFLERTAKRLVRVNSPGNLTEYALPSLQGTPESLVVDRDGSFWYVVSGEASDGGSGPGSGSLVHIAFATSGYR